MYISIPFFPRTIRDWNSLDTLSQSRLIPQPHMGSFIIYIYCEVVLTIGLKFASLYMCRYDALLFLLCLHFLFHI